MQGIATLVNSLAMTCEFEVIARRAKPDSPISAERKIRNIKKEKNICKNF